MQVLIDTNVFLDSILQRAPWHRDADAVLQAGRQGIITCNAASLSLATAFYVARKASGAAKARAAVQAGLSAFTILPVDKQALLDADAMPGGDFEDNIQIAVAKAASLDAIITRNTGDFIHSPIPALDPATLLQRLASGTSPPAP